ncbi:MAG TPA: saccharopine dehydrogenase NADP-binding domain-containing protein [Friedmanniella sp.]
MTACVITEEGHMVDVWILGGTGRVGRSVAGLLAASGIEPVLVGRDAERLRAAVGVLGNGGRTYVAASVEATAAAIREARPAAVVNTVGPFSRTAPAVVDACLVAGSDYVDLANDVDAVPALLARQADAERAGRTLVTGAGFGVVATESVVAWLCAEPNRGTRSAARVRTDMVPSLALQAGALGEALAATLTEGLPGVPGGRRFQGRRIADGRLAPAPVGGEVRALVTPDGDRVSTGLMPLGELVAAQRASGAPFVDAASSEVPHGRLARAVLPVATNLLSVAPLRRFATRRLAAVRFAARPAPRAHSWGHAVVTWTDATTSEGWLRLPEAQATTDAVAADVVRRLVAGEGRPGAFTPAALFGPALATSLGGVYSRTDGAA